MFLLVQIFVSLWLDFWVAAPAQKCRRPCPQVVAFCQFVMNFRTTQPIQFMVRGCTKVLF